MLAGQLLMRLLSYKELIMSKKFNKIDDKQINNASDAIRHLDELFNRIRKQISHHDFDCVLAYLNEKYGIDKL